MECYWLFKIIMAMQRIFFFRAMNPADRYVGGFQNLRVLVLVSSCG